MYRDFTYLNSVHKFLLGLSIDEHETDEFGGGSWFDIIDPRTGSRKSVEAQRAAIYKVAKEMGIRVITMQPVDCLLVRRVA